MLDPRPRPAVMASRGCSDFHPRPIATRRPSVRRTSPSGTLGRNGRCRLLTPGSVVGREAPVRRAGRSRGRRGRRLQARRHPPTEPTRAWRPPGARTHHRMTMRNHRLPPLRPRNVRLTAPARQRVPAGAQIPRPMLPRPTIPGPPLGSLTALRRHPWRLLSGRRVPRVRLRPRLGRPTTLRVRRSPLRCGRTVLGMRPWHRLCGRTALRLRRHPRPPLGGQTALRRHPRPLLRGRTGRSTIEWDHPRVALSARRARPGVRNHPPVPSAARMVRPGVWNRPPMPADGPTARPPARNHPRAPPRD
jgi:hypothetical protein